MKALMVLGMLISFSCYSFELSPVASGTFSTQKTSAHQTYFFYLTIADDGSVVNVKHIDYTGNLFLSYGDWLCQRELGSIRCSIKPTNDQPEDFIKQNSSNDIGNCRQSIDMTNFIAHDSDSNFYVLENRYNRSLFSLDKKSCTMKAIVLGKEEKKLSDQLGLYIGASNGIVIYYRGDNDETNWWDIGQFDLYGRLNEEENSGFDSNSFLMDVGTVDFSNTGILAVTKYVDRDVPKEKLNLLKGSMDAYKSYICFYTQENLKLSKESCHDIIPVDKYENSISIESLAISDNGKYFALLFKNENNENEIRSYELR
jgi:hypothetical protein